MINLDKLYYDESYALKILIDLIDKYVTTDEDKLKAIIMVSSFPGCIPGRRVGGIFDHSEISEHDRKVIQEIINIYG